jgi:cation diffusion facilitator family transporter
MFSSKENVSRLSILTIGSLIIIKVIASVITGSIGIRADALHSIIDLSGAIIGYIGIRVSDKPPDKNHAFGHSKAENIAGVIIAGLIFIAAGSIFYEAIHKLIVGGTVELVTVGIYVTAAAIAINILISRYAMRVARATDSLALEATARDMTADVLSSCAVLLGLILVGITGLTVLDPIVALLVAILIARTAFVSMRKSFGGLMDTRLSKEEENEIKECINEHSKQLVSFHELRTRKAGNRRFIDLHLVMPKKASVEEAHKMCDHLEQDLENRLTNTDVTIHVEPCAIECEQCSVTCSIRKKKLSK